MMYCGTCGEGLEARWRYCPICGGRVHRRSLLERFPGFSRFGSLFKDIDREFRRIEEGLRGFPGANLKEPYRGGGVSIRITSETGKEPEVKVRTFGDYREHEPEIMRRLGAEKKKRPLPKVTEEPETEIRRAEGRLVVRMKIPGVESEEDVETRRMEESVEVRAYAEDKAYFTLFSIPRGHRILSKKLERGELTLEIG